MAARARVSAWGRVWPALPGSAVAPGRTDRAQRRTCRIRDHRRTRRPAGTSVCGQAGRVSTMAITVPRATSATKRSTLRALPWRIVGFPLPFRAPLGQPPYLPDRPQRRGEGIGFCREFTAGIGNEAVDFFVGEVEGHTSDFVQTGVSATPLRRAWLERGNNRE